jgi:asparagine N-glycosylation enzyme membrane subunit Stt3
MFHGCGYFYHASSVHFLAQMGFPSSSISSFSVLLWFIVVVVVAVVVYVADDFELLILTLPPKPRITDAPCHT